MRSWPLIAIIAGMMTGCLPEPEETASAIKVEIANTQDGYVLLRGGMPYKINGAGMGIDDIARFAGHGGNSIRNWTTIGDSQDTRALLDSAHVHGVTVALCLPMQAERGGFDYDDAHAVAAQLQQMREEVIKYRDHPALLFWIIGNELNHSYRNSAVYDAVNDVAKMIHSLDPNHPATTTVSGFDRELLREIASRAPELDFLSFQLYGKLFNLNAALQAIGFEEPFMVTEWGSIGYWEMEKTSWGTPVELTSSEKADFFLRGYEEVLEKFAGQLIGSYVFLWGQKQERTPTWFSLLTETGEETEAVDVMHYVWTGSWPENRAPHVNAILLDGKGHRQSVVLVANESYEAKFEVRDVDNDALRYRWDVKPESEATQSGGDFEEPILNLEGLLTNPTSPITAITVDQPGKYRLFAYAYDAHGHAAHANIPFLVRERSE